tara:strand:+ start:334 stop:549 length:216 start_codon:yes stop_codon:yes gene_type:complete
VNLIEEKIMTIIPDFNGMKTGTGTTGSTLDIGMDTMLPELDIITGMVLVGIILLVITYLADLLTDLPPPPE